MRYFRYLIAVIFTTTLLVSCNDWDNPVQDRGTYPNPSLENVIPAFFTMDFETSFVAFDVVMSEEDQAKIDNAYLQIAYTGADGVKGDAVKLQDLTTFPAAVEVSAEDAIAAVGKTNEDIAIGDIFSLEVITVVNGVSTKSTAAIDAAVTCAFDENLTSGKYAYSSSGWETAGSVDIIADEEDPYSASINVTGLAEGDGLVGTDNLMKITIDPNSYAVTSTSGKVVVAESMASYTNLAYELVSGSYDSCSGDYTLTFALTVDQGSFGSFSFSFTAP
ncbi:MAG: hypothetical protein ACK5JS_00310 [Mangrovibacterium sp.]